MKTHEFLTSFLLIIFLQSICSVCFAVDENHPGYHIIKGVPQTPGYNSEYIFKNTPDDIPFIITFSLNKLLNDPEIVEIEREAFQTIQKDNASQLLATGKNFVEHLVKNYGVTFEKDAYLTNGLYFDRYRKFLDQKFNISDLNRFGINLDPNSKIIFSWGRCSVAKGFKELLEAWQDVVESLPDYHLIIQSPNNSGEDSYFRLLKEYEQNIPRTIVIDDFNPEIWQTVLRTQNTDIVCIPSVMDPNPHTAIEAKLFSTGTRYVIVGSNADGVKDTYINDECLWVNPYDKKDFSNSLIKASKLSEEERQKMNEVNNKNLSNYDYAKNIKDFLKNVE